MSVKEVSLPVWCICFVALSACHHVQATAPTESTQNVTETQKQTSYHPTTLGLTHGRYYNETILIGEQPTDAQFQAAAAEGFRTVVNLRTPKEQEHAEQPRVEAFGMNYIALPINGADGITRQNAQTLATAIAAAEKPILLHCSSGQRAAALLTLVAHYTEGKDIDSAIAAGRSIGLSKLEPRVREVLETTAMQSK
ncbi:MAG: sulfur transferase domain-containing protein [Myxococcota bacterium]